MINVPAKAPTAQVRHLLPFAARLAGRFADMDRHWQTVALLTESALLLTLRSQERPYPKLLRLQSCPRQNALLYTALERKAVANGDDQLEGEAKVTFDARAH